MLELITQYGPYLFLVLAAFFLFAAGHHVGSSTAATSAPAAITATTVAPAATVLSNVGEDGRVELSLVPIESKKEDVAKSADPAADVGLVGTPSKHPDALDSILPTKELVSAPLADIQAAISAAPAEVSKAHDALDKIGVYGPARMQLIAGVRLGQVTADDIVRSHPVPQEAKVPFGATGLPSQDTSVATSEAPVQHIPV